MNRKFWAVLMAAGALLPFAAQAQDRERVGERGWRGGERGQAMAPAQADAPQAPRFEGYRRGPGGVEGGQQNPGYRGQDRGQRPAPAPAPAPPPQAQQPQAQPPVAQDRGGPGRGPGGWQGGDRRGGPGGDRGGWNGGPPRQPPQGTPPQARPPEPGRDWNRDQDRRGDRGRPGQWQDHRDPRTAPRDQVGGRNDWRENRGWQNGRDGSGWRGDREFRNWNREWRRDNRYDWQRYRYQNRSHYRLPRYYAPRGWTYGYRRFSIGVTLDRFLFGENYWIGDPGYYRLPPAYGPYRWVRYYDDALLVDVYSGEVVDVIYGIFW